MTSTGLSVQESELGRLEPIGKGGMAHVFQTPDYYVAESADDRLVYKKYKKSVRPVPTYGLEALVKVRSRMHPDQRAAFDRSTNWPRRVVLDAHPGAAGVVLPLISDQYFIELHLPSGDRERKPAEGQFLFQDQAYCDLVKIPYADLNQRLMLCRSLIYALGLLHRADVVYGDLSARNFIYRLEPRPQVLLVDCDAVRLRGSSAPIGAQPHTPDWEPPESLRAKRMHDRAGAAIQNKETDRYKLGLAILRILTPGVISTNRDPGPARRWLPAHLFAMLKDSLADDPKRRPDAKAWFQAWARSAGGGSGA